jgi:hypothetical protein
VNVWLRTAGVGARKVLEGVEKQHDPNDEKDRDPRGE